MADLLKRDQVKRQSPYSAMTVSVVVSENTQKAIKYLIDGAKLMKFGNPGAVSEMDPRRLTDGITQVLASRFKAVNVAATPDAARDQRPDVIMLYDAKVALGKMSGMKTTADVTGIFMDADQRVIDTVSGTGASTIPYPAFTTKVPVAIAAALEQFGASLDQSAKLQALARGDAPELKAAEPPRAIVGPTPLMGPPPLRRTPAPAPSSGGSVSPSPSDSNAPVIGPPPLPRQ